MEKYRQQLGRQPPFILPSTKRAEAKRIIVSGKQDPVAQFIKTQEEARIAKKEKKAIQLESEILVKEFAETEAGRTRGISEIGAELKKLGEHEAKIKEFEEKGFEVETKEGELVFTKPAVYKTRKEQPTVVVVWRSKTGRVGYQSGAWEHREMFIRSIEAVGGTVLDVKYSPTRYVKVKIEPQVIKGTGYYIDPSYGTWEEMVALAAKLEARVEYKEKGEVPATVASQIDVPSEFATIGLTKEYQKEIYEYSLGMDTQLKTQQQLQKILGERLETIPEWEAVAWAKEYAKFGEQTWKQAKTDEPALELIRTEEDFETVIDVEKWREEEYKHLDPITATIRRQTTRFLGGFAHPEYIYHSMISQPWVEGEPHARRAEQIITEKEYRLTQAYKSGDIAATAMEVATSPPMTSIVYPLGMGAVLKPLIGAIATYGTETVGGFTGKVISKALPAYFAATVPVIVGTDIGVTFAKEHKGLLPEGAGIGKAGQYVTQFTMFGLGAKYTPYTKEQVLSLAHKVKTLPSEVMARTPGLRGIATEIGTFKVIGRYKAGVSPPSELYTRVTTRMGEATESIEMFIGRQQFLKQQVAISKTTFEHPIPLETRARYRAIISQYALTGEPRIRPRVGYVLPYGTIEQLKPVGGWLIKPSPEVMPYMEIVGDQYFTQLIYLDEPKGILLEYKFPHAKVHTRPKIEGLPYEYDIVRRGKGEIFAPDMPGKYKLGGKEVFLRPGEGYETFTGERTTWREFAGRAEQIGKPSTIYPEGRVHIPERLPHFTTEVRTPLAPFERIPATISYTQKVKGEFYEFLTFTKQTDLPPLTTTVTGGLGRTIKLYELMGKFRGHKMEVSRYFTYGEYYQIKDPITDVSIGKHLLPQVVSTGVARGRGLVYDLTQWFGAEDPSKAMPSEHTLAFMLELKKKPVTTLILAQKLMTGITTPPSRQLPAPKTDTIGTISKQTPVTIAKTGKVVLPISMFSVKTDIATATKMEHLKKTITKNIEKQTSKVLQKELQKPIIEVATRPLTKTLQEPMTKVMQKELTKQLQKPITKQLQKPMTKVMQKELTKMLQKPLTKQLLKPITKPITKPLQKPALKLPPVIIEIIEIVPPPPPPFLPDFKEFEPKILRLKDWDKRKKGARKRMHPVELLFKDIYGLEINYEI